jgi:MoxR-like ATPase
MATQNPVEFRGTYPLPEAQMDRFAMQFGLGYIEPEEEAAMLGEQQDVHPLERLRPCATVEDVRALRRAARAVRVSEEIKRYVVDLAAATRKLPSVQLGASPRGSLALMKVAQAMALFDGLDFVTPDLVKELAAPVLAHRLVLDPQSRFSGLNARLIVEDLVRNTPVPA